MLRSIYEERAKPEARPKEDLAPRLRVVRRHAAVFEPGLYSAERPRNNGSIHILNWRAAIRFGKIFATVTPMRRTPT